VLRLSKLIVSPFTPIVGAYQLTLFAVTMITTEAESIVVGTVRLAHCHEVLLVVAVSLVVGPVETPVFVRVTVLVEKAVCVIVSTSVGEPTSDEEEEARLSSVF
jgi:hypothetical protein